MEKRIIITGGSGFIGTNLVEFYKNQGWRVLNVDFNPPRNSNHASMWLDLDILEKDRLKKAFKEFQPDFILQFAARTDLDESKEVAGYQANIEGVQNVIDAVRATPSIQRIIVASSQLVCKIGYQPKNEEDYCPSTSYGKSKVQTEKIVRSSKLDIPWVLLRPTSIWGPWFDVPYKNFFETIQKGLYIHPAGVNTYKQWGFVLNSVHQIQKLMVAQKEQINRKTFYLADYQLTSLHDFANLIQQEMHSRSILSVPYGLLRLAGYLGDALQVIGWKTPPLTSFRLHNIVTNELQDLNPLESVTGPLPYSEQEGIRITVDWLNKFSK